MIPKVHTLLYVRSSRLQYVESVTGVSQIYGLTLVSRRAGDHLRLID